MRLEYIMERQDGCIDLCRKCWAAEGCEGIDPFGSTPPRSFPASEWISEFLNHGYEMLIPAPSPRYGEGDCKGWVCLCCGRALTEHDMRL